MLGLTDLVSTLQRAPVGDSAWPTCLQAHGEADDIDGLIGLYEEGNDNMVRLAPLPYAVDGCLCNILFVLLLPC